MAWSDDMTGLSAAVTGAFGVTVTYRAVARGAYTAASGAVARTNTDTAITAIRGRQRRTTNENLHPIIEAIYFVAVTQVASPQVGDQILDGTETFTVASVEASVDKTGHDLTVYRSRG